MREGRTESRRTARRTKRRKAGKPESRKAGKPESRKAADPANGATSPNRPARRIAPDRRPGEWRNQPQPPGPANGATSPNRPARRIAPDQPAPTDPPNAKITRPRQLKNRFPRRKVRELKAKHRKPYQQTQQAQPEIVVKETKRGNEESARPQVKTDLLRKGHET
jgi:hypothetical protein